MEAERPLTAEDCLSLNRANLTLFAQQFHTAVELFTFLERGGNPPHVGVFGGIFIQYRMIAARDAALAVYHFGCTLDAIKKMVPQSVTASTAVDTADINRIITLFDVSFPHSKMIRNAIAHAGELYSSLPKVKNSMQRKDAEYHGGYSSSGGILLAAIYERTYTLSKGGSVFSFTVDHGVTLTLAGLLRQVDEAFRAYDGKSQQPS